MDKSYFFKYHLYIHPLYYYIGATTTMWGSITKLEEDHVRRQRTVGAVVVNGEVNKTIVSMARKSAKPYYKVAAGSDSNNFSEIEGGDIVFTIRNNEHSVNTYSQNMTNSHNKLKGVSVLNGLGQHNEKKDNGHVKLAQRIEILGIAEMGNINNSSGLFTILRGGEVQVTNNWCGTIEPNTWIIAHPPSLTELKEGGKGKQSDRNGVAKLQYKPYDPIKNALKTKQIHDCLTAPEDEDYTKMYRRTCKRFKQTIKDMALVVIASEYEKIRAIMTPGKDRVAGLKEIDALFTKEDKNIQDTLFAAHIPNKAYIEDGAKNSALNQKQVSSMDQFLCSVSVLHHDTVNLIIGKSLNAAAPKKDFVIDLKDYGLK